MTYCAAFCGLTPHRGNGNAALDDHKPNNDALVAQLDRALDYESRGREFESSRARHSSFQNPRNTKRFTCPDTGGDTFGDTNGKGHTFPY